MEVSYERVYEYRRSQVGKLGSMSAPCALSEKNEWSQRNSTLVGQAELRYDFAGRIS